MGPSELDVLDMLELDGLQLVLEELTELGTGIMELDDRLDGGKEELLIELLELLPGVLPQTAPVTAGRCAGLLATPLLP